MRRSFFFLFLFVFLSGCVGGESLVLHGIETPLAFDQVSGGTTTTQFVTPHAFYGPDGSVKQGQLIWSSQNPTLNQRYVDASGEAGGVLWTKLNADSYRWGWFGEEDLGFALIGIPLDSGRCGTVEAQVAVAWCVERISGSAAVVNWTREDSGETYWLSSFMAPIPIPFRTETIGPGGSHIKTNEDFRRVEAPGVAPFPEAQTPLPSAQVGPNKPLFALWNAFPFAFADALEVWKTDERYTVAATWLDAHPAAQAVEVAFHVVDENDGNATAYQWAARFHDGGSLLSVQVALRFTHPSEEMRSSYPFYDQCPHGCHEPYGKLPVVSNRTFIGAPIAWPESAASSTSLVARAEMLIPDLPAVGMEWTLMEYLPGNRTVWREWPLVKTLHDQAVIVWDADPDVGAIGGRIDRGHFLQRHLTNSDLRGGDVWQISTPDRIF